MSSPEAAGQMALWAIELSEFDIHYRPRTAIKGQAVADFIAEYTLAGGAGVVIQTPDGDTIECMIRLDFPTTNNEAEYEALLAGLDLAKAAGAEAIVVHCDSLVVVSQIGGTYECRGEK
nr:hypothetical protein CFP56_15097 [Quercus suber]